ncbi:MAG: response regulator transcription factor [Granulosicoccus sp.]|nr:response regulator transcription factor [Granulosicoccus sp.]
MGKYETNTAVLIENDPEIGTELRCICDDYFDQVEHFTQLDDSLSQILCVSWNVLLLDSCVDVKELPKLLIGARKFNQAGQIIVLSDNNSDGHIGNLFKYGIDDYIRKSVGRQELVARIKAARRRSADLMLRNSNLIQGCANNSINTLPYNLDNENCINLGDVKLNLTARTASIRDKFYNFTQTEFSLLVYMVESTNMTVSKASLLEEVLGYNDDVYLPSLHSHIKRIRRKLEKGGSKTTSIETVWCYGYRVLVKSEEKQSGIG